MTQRLWVVFTIIVCFMNTDLVDWLVDWFFPRTVSNYNKIIRGSLIEAFKGHSHEKIHMFFWSDSPENNK